MTNTQTGAITVPPCVSEWAKGWKEKDMEYLQNASRFGSPLVKRIANYILSINHETQENNELYVLDGKVRESIKQPQNAKVHPRPNRRESQSNKWSEYTNNMI